MNKPSQDKLTPAEIAIIISKKYIQDNNDINNDKLSVIFQKIPFEQIEIYNANLILSDFLNIAYTYKNKFAIKIIFEAWERVYSPEGDISIFSFLFTISTIPKNAFTFAIRSFEDITFSEVIIDLIHYDRSIDILPACNLAVDVFGEQTFKTYENLREEAKMNDNLAIEEFMIAKMEEIAPFQPKPSWVKQFLTDSLPKENELVDFLPILEQKVELPSNEDAVQLLTSKLYEQGISIDNKEGEEEEKSAKAELRVYLKIATREEKLHLLESILSSESQELVQKELEYYRNLFRFYGPINVSSIHDDDNNNDDDDNNEYRMFLCDMYDYDEDYGFIRPWFRGSCDHCHKKIQYSWYAVRSPKPSGGWAGCYCSYECVRNDIDRSDESEQSKELNEIIESLINVFELKMNQIGIQDRLPSDN